MLKSRTFVASAVSVALACLVASVVAQTEFITSSQNDIRALNYVLRLEQLSSNYWQTGLANFTNDNLTAAGFGSATTNLQTISNQDATHVNSLVNAVNLLGGTAVSPCTYNYDVHSVQDFLQRGFEIETLKSDAYNGVLARFSNDSLITLASTINTNDARHAAYLATVLGGDPFPSAFDRAIAPDNIISQLTTPPAGQIPLITACPDTDGLPLPVPRSDLTTESPTNAPTNAPTNPPTPAPTNGGGRAAGVAGLATTAFAVVVAALRF